MERHDPPKRQSKVAGTIFDIIEALDQLDEASVTELADHLDLAASTVHNHLATLQQRDYVVNEDGVYRPGLRFLTLGSSIRKNHPVSEIVSPIIEDLSTQTGESAWVATLENDKIVFLYGEPDDDGVQMFGRIGSRRLPHANAAGKAIMTYLPEEVVTDIIDRTGLPKRTENTITSREKLFEEFESIRQRGFAVNRGEYFESGRAIACAIIRDGHPVGALGISGPAHRFQEEQITDDLSEPLMEKKNILELKLTEPA